MHDTMDVVDIDSVTGRPLVDTPRHRHHWFYEHDQNGPVFRTLLDGKVDSIRVDDPGWRGDEGRQGFKLNVTTIVDSYRHEFATNRLRDAGETTFAGRSAGAYDVVGEPGGQTQTYYIDAETALPLGKVMTVDTYPPRLDAAHKPSAKLTITEIVKRFERLAPTPQNVAKLDAPAIDAHR
jgi:hypothetical protein